MESERLLPIANVGRIMRKILPESAKISKEGKQIMQECATEFISFVTEEASDKCHQENRKTLNGDDICWALTSLGFDHYADALSTYLLKYRQSSETHKVIINPHKTVNNNKPHHLHPCHNSPPVAAAAAAKLSASSVVVVQSSDKQLLMTGICSAGGGAVDSEDRVSDEEDRYPATN